MMKRKSNFTLIELIVVIVVLGILAAIVLPNIQSFRKKASNTAKVADLRNIQTAVDMYRADADDLDGIGFVDTDAAVGVQGKVITVTEDAKGETLKDAQGVATPKKFVLVSLDTLQNDLRKVPAYVKDFADFGTLDASKGHVSVAVELSATSTLADGGDVTNEDLTGKLAFVRGAQIILD